MISIITGAVALAVLDAVVSNPAHAQNVGGWFDTFSGLVRDFLSPEVPAFANSTPTAKPAATTAPASGSVPVELIPTAVAPGGTTTPTTLAPGSAGVGSTVGGFI